MQVVLVAVMGGKAGSLLDTVEALHRERKMQVAEAFVIVGRREMERVHAKILDAGTGLDRLREKMGDAALLDHDRFHLRIARRPNGQILDEDIHPSDAACFREALWRTTGDAITLAGARPVVFVVLPDLRRSATAVSTAIFQLLGRDGDVLFDARDDLYPGKRVALIELELLKLGGKLEGTVLTSFQSALDAVRARDERAPPLVRIDLAEGWVDVDGHLVDLSPAERLWYAYLAWWRADRPDGWVLVGRDGHEELLAFLRRVGARRRTSEIRSKPLRQLLEAESVDDDDLRNLRGKTVQRMKRWCSEHAPDWAQLLVPQTDGNGHQRIALTAHRIEIRGLPVR